MTLLVNFCVQKMTIFGIDKAGHSMYYVQLIRVRIYVLDTGT